MDYQHLTKDRSLGSVELRISDLVKETKENKEMPYSSKGRDDFIEHFRLDKNNTYKGKLFFDAEFVPAILLKDIHFDVPKNELEQIVEDSRVDGVDASGSSSNTSQEDLVSPVSTNSQNGAAAQFQPGHSKNAKSTDTAKTADTSVTGYIVDSNAEAPYEGIIMSKEELLKHREY